MRMRLGTVIALAVYAAAIAGLVLLIGFRVAHSISGSLP